MSRAPNPVVWLTWGAAVTLATVVTRNPLYLSLVLLSTIVVHLACQPSGGPTIWSLVIKIGSVVAAVSILFNLFTAHAGENVLFTLPDEIPIVGGVITTNALVYGISSALAILALIVAAATFASVVDRASLLRIVPRVLAPAGIAAIIGLSFFPQTIASLREVREAQAARGFRMRSVRDVVPLVVPVLSLALEGAFNLAEAMESRAFGSNDVARQSRSWLFPTGILTTLAAVSLVIGGWIVAATICAAAGIALTGFGLFAQRSSRTTYRDMQWDLVNWLLLSASLLSIVIVATALLFNGGLLDWSPFPTLARPRFAPLLGVAYLLLVAPALRGGRSS